MLALPRPYIIHRMPAYKLPNGRWIVSVSYKGKKAMRRLPEGATKAKAKALEIELAAQHKRDIDAELKVTEKRKGRVGNLSLMVLLEWIEHKHAPTLRSPRTALHAVKELRQYEELRDNEGLWYPKASDCPRIAQLYIDKNPHLSPASTNRVLGVLRKSLSHHFRIGDLDTDWSRRIPRRPENNVSDVYMSEEEATRIAAHASPKVQAAIFIALYMGLRRGEICKLRKEDIVDGTLIIQSGNTKTLQQRRLPIPKKAKPYLKLVPLNITPMGLGSSFLTARKKAGVEKPFHSLRHGCASALVQAGVDLYTVSKILGHSSVTMSTRYAKLATDNLKAALNKI